MQTVVREFTSDAVRAAMPHPEAHVVVRFKGDGIIDVHAIGARERVHRKSIRGGLRIVMTRLPLGTTKSVLGASATEIAGRIVELEDLWGDAALELRDRLSRVRDVSEAAALLERAVAARITTNECSDLVTAAADRLGHASVRSVADELGVSERQLRRVFRDAVGVSPKAFARLVRFHRAVDAARSGASWTWIAADTGYCDQAHLIDEFHAIAGSTPRSFMTELAESLH